MQTAQTRVRTPSAMDPTAAVAELAAGLDDLLSELIAAAGHLDQPRPLRRARFERHISAMTRAERLRLAGALHLLTLREPISGV